MALADGLDAIMATLVALGIENVPDEPPETLAGFPVGVVYSTQGTTQDQPFGSMTMHDSITVAVMVARGNLPAAVRALKGYRESVPAAIYSALHAGTLAPIVNIDQIRHTLGPITWGGSEAFGYLFTLDGVKTQQDL